MPQFSRGTILAVTDTISRWSHSDINRLLLEYGLENSVAIGSRAERANQLGNLLINAHLALPDGGSVADGIVHEVVKTSIASTCALYMRDIGSEEFGKEFPKLKRALGRDGFTIERGELRKTLPHFVDLPTADNEVHHLLARYGFSVSKSHLDQGIGAHLRGDWAAANAQFRAFVESLLDEIAERLGGGHVVPGVQRRIWLANVEPPFFVKRLHEWEGQGRGFIEAFFRRLHPEGAHPGLSDEDDSTFRLHLILLVGRNLLKRIHDR